MNARRVHELMLEHFPSPDMAALDWVNVSDGAGLNVERLHKRLGGSIESETLLVEVSNFW